jgi:hypothetical protein
VTEMEERVAKAIGDLIYGYVDQTDTPNNWANAVGMARAAFTEMRKPTEAMQLAGHNVRNDPKTGLPTHCGTDEIFTAMIEAALAPPT